MTNSREIFSPNFWIAVICTLLATIPFELPSNNTAITTLFSFSVMFGLLLHSEATAKLSLSIKILIWAAFLSAILIVSNFKYPSDFAISLSVLTPAVILLAGIAWRSARTLNVIDAVIAINMFFLYLQLTYYFISGNIIEFHTLLFPFSSSRVGEFIGVIRLGGLHIEPGTYSAFVFALLLARHLLGGAPSDKIFFLAGLSLIVTFSAWGIIAGLVVFSVIILSRSHQSKRNKIIVVSGMLFLTALVQYSTIFYFLADYTLQRFEPSAGSASYRIEVFSVLVQELPTYILIGRPFEEVFCAECISPQDLGVFSQLIVRLGATSSLIVFVYALRPYLFTSFPTLILVLFFFTGKYDLAEPIFWFVLGLAFNGRRRFEEYAAKKRVRRRSFSPQSP